jgi:hypothetical protein
MIEVDNLFYWDAYGVKVGDELNIEITFKDIKGVLYPLVVLGCFIASRSL